MAPIRAEELGMRQVATKTNEIVINSTCPRFPIVHKGGGKIDEVATYAESCKCG